MIEAHIQKRFAINQINEAFCFKTLMNFLEMKTIRFRKNRQYPPHQYYFRPTKKSIDFLLNTSSTRTLLPLKPRPFDRV